MRTNINLSLLVLSCCFATTVFAKVDDKPLAITILVTPTKTTVARAKDLKLITTVDYNFKTFSYAGNSFFSRYDANRIVKLDTLNLLDFNKIDTNEDFSYKVLPFYDYPQSSQETPNMFHKDVPGISLNLLLIKFPLF